MYARRSWRTSARVLDELVLPVGAHRSLLTSTPRPDLQESPAFSAARVNSRGKCSPVQRRRRAQASLRVVHRDGNVLARSNLSRCLACPRASAIATVETRSAMRSLSISPAWDSSRHSPFDRSDLMTSRGTLRSLRVLSRVGEQLDAEDPICATLAGGGLHPDSLEHRSCRRDRGGLRRYALGPDELGEVSGPSSTIPAWLRPL